MITYLNQDGDVECVGCGFVVYLTGAPPSLEDMADAEKPQRRREPRFGNKGKGWL